MSRDPIADGPRKTTEEMVLEMHQMELNRRARLVQLDEQYGAYSRVAWGQPFYVDAEGDFALVERSTYDSGHYYLTLHKTLEDAATYHDNQEYPLDWTIEFLENVDTGLRYEPVQATTFVPFQEAS